MLFSFILVILTVYPRLSQQACDSGWFGDKCQYQCHCIRQLCADNGECQSGAACQSGWFGRACQYVDMVVTGSVTSNNALTSFNGYRCYTADLSAFQHLHSSRTVVHWDKPFLFTWLRLLYSERDKEKNVTLQFVDQNDRTVNCINNREVVDGFFRDIYCFDDIKVKEIQVSPAVCSVWVSGGRNVALKQDATQSTNYFMDTPEQLYMASKAVDGNRDSGTHARQCTHTALSDSHPTWTLTLTPPQNVHRFILINRDDCCTDRLVGFTLSAVNEDKKTLLSYKDRGISAKAMYDVRSDSLVGPVSKILVAAARTRYGNLILTLCEVEIYGDSACDIGKFGLGCEQVCHCADQEPCEASAGVCPHGCAAGFTGKNCNLACPPTYYGDCMRQCSQHCVDHLCHPVTGNCYECPAGRAGAQCKIVGPTSLQIYSVSSFPLCPGDKDFLTVICKVPVTDVNPNPIFRVYANHAPGSPHLLVGNTEETPDEYVYTTSLRPAVWGYLTVKCHAENSANSSMFVEDHKTVVIQEPPEAAPSISINGEFINETVTLSEGDNLNVSCWVDGGYPPVTNINLTCADISAIDQGNVTSLTDVSVSRYWNKKSCTCTAQHESGCYERNNRTVDIIVKYPPNSPPALKIYEGQVYHGQNSSTIALSDGDNISVACWHDGGNPPISNLSLTCPGHRATNQGRMTSLVDVTVTREWNGQFCTCAVQHEMGDYGDNTTSVMIHIRYYLRSVNLALDSSTAGPYHVCPGKTDTLSVNCEVPVEDVFPSPVFLILVNNESVTTQPEPGIQTATVYRYTNSVTPTNGGNLTVTCRAVNAMDSTMFEEASETIFIQEPPKVPPTLMINDQMSNSTDNDTVALSVGDHVNVTCWVDGGYPPVDTITVICEDYSVTEPGSMASLLDLPVTREWNERQCTCTAQHESGCYEENTKNVTITIKYFIRSVNIAFDNSTDNPFPLCPGKTDTVSVNCEVPVEDVFPSPVFLIFVNNESVTTQPEPGIQTAVVYRYTDSVTPTNGGNLTVTCRAENAMDSTMFEEAPGTIFIQEPPNVPPALKINGQVFNSTNYDTVALSVGDHVNVTCWVDGGYPLVTNITLTCEDYSGTEQGSMASLMDLPVTREWNERQCICTAQHESGCYEENTKNVSITIKYFLRSVKIAFDNSTDNPFPLCPGRTDTLSVNCEVPVEDVFPSPVFLILVNNESVTTQPEPGIQTAAVYRYTNSVTPTNGGNLTVTCRAENAMDSTMFEEAPGTIFIQEPPNVPPALKINGQVFNSTNYDTVALSVGDHVKVTCWVDGGYPLVTNITLNCEGYSGTEQGSMASLMDLPLTREWNERQCICTAQHESGCYEENTKNVSITIRYYLKYVGLVAHRPPGPLVLCPGRNISLVLECKVPVSYVFPDPLFRVYVNNRSMTTLAQPQSLLNNVYSYAYHWVPSRGGRSMVKCYAENSANSSIAVDKEAPVFIQEPPKTPPILCINGQIYNSTDDTLVELTEGDNLNITCWEDGGYPSVNHISIDCFNHNASDHGHVTSLGDISVNRAWHDQSCTCTADHDSGCYDENSRTVMFKINYGPESVRLHIDKPRVTPFHLCTNEEVSVICEVPVDDVYPAPMLSVSVNTQLLTTELDPGIQVGDVFRSTSVLKPTDWGDLTITCRAENSVHGSLYREEELTVHVLEPPKSAPTISINGEIFNSAGPNAMTILSGNNLNVSCWVDGDYPPVSSISLACGNNSIIEQGSSASLVDVSPETTMTNRSCDCVAHYDNGCHYSNNRVVTIYTVVKAESRTEDDSSSGIGIGVGCTVIVLVVVAIAVVAWYMHKRREEKKDQAALVLEEEPPNMVHNSMYDSDNGAYNDEGE